MPELPEVETVVRGLRAHGLEGAVIRHVEVRWPRTVEGGAVEAFCRALTGHAVTTVSRQGKNILIALETGDVVHVHLRMTGKFRFAERAEHAGPHDHVVIRLAEGRTLFFNDTRKFGRFRLLRRGERLEGVGPDALDRSFTLEVFLARLAGHRRMIKPLLLDQAVLAGLGNIYVDESLWEAGLHPQSRAHTLTRAQRVRLYKAIRGVLGRAVKQGGTTLGSGEGNFYSVAGHRGRNADNLRVFRRDGEECSRCGAILVRTVVAQRGTHFCPRCQRR